MVQYLTRKRPYHYKRDQISKEVAVKMYTDMVTLQVMDTIFYEAQRQGRISFYLTCIGEEAINIASAAALNFEDLVFPQVRMDLNQLCTIFLRDYKCENTCFCTPILHVHACIHTERIQDISLSFFLSMLSFYTMLIYNSLIHWNVLFWRPIWLTSMYLLNKVCNLSTSLTNDC